MAQRVKIATGEAMASWTRIILTVFLGVALWAIASVMARAEIRIIASPGGEVGPFLDLCE